MKSCIIFHWEVIAYQGSCNTPGELWLWYITFKQQKLPLIWGVKVLHYIVVTYARVVCLIYALKLLRAAGPRHITTIMWHLVIGHKPTYITLMVANIKHTSTQLHVRYPLGYKYNCEIVCSRVKLPSKAFTKMEVEFSKYHKLGLLGTSTCYSK